MRVEPLEVLLFGGFTVQQGGEPLPPIPSRAGRSLLAYLVVNRRRAHSRDELVGTFWPDLPEGRARRRLSHTLWQIQDSLGELQDGGSYLDVTSERLAFDTSRPYWLDVEEFERRLVPVRSTDREHPLNRASDLEHLRTAVELYRGDFLSGFYDDWVQLEQERLGQLHLSALAELVQLAKSQGDYDEALTYARRLTHHDPLREDAHREVMRLSVLLGRPSEALRQYERCRSVLLEELGAEPAAATLQLYQRISRQRRAGSPTSWADDGRTVHPRLPLVGRDRERSVLVDRMERVLAGRGGVVLIEGEPGVGKSRLVEEAAEDARWRGFNVLAGVCREPGARPYQPLADALAGELSPVRSEQLAARLDEVWFREAARALPGLARTTPPQRPAAPLRGLEESTRMCEAVIRLVTEFGRIAPTVLVLEDVHWADDETLRVLEALAGRIAGTRVLTVLTYRADDARDRDRVWSAIRTVDRDARPDRVLLEPLTAFGTAELLRGSLGSREVPPTFASRLQRETGGNPLFVLETVRALREGGHLDEVTSGEVDVPLPSGIHDVIAGRLVTLPAAVREVLAVAAVQALELDLDVLVAASGLSRAEVADAIAVLLDRGVLEEDEDGYRFSHDQVRRVAELDLDDHERRALHRRVGDALADLRPDAVEALAHHYLEADEPASALTYLRRAAERAADLHAYETAARHLRHALDAVDRVPTAVADRLDLLGRYEHVLSLLARRDEQAETLAAMSELADDDPATIAGIRCRATWLHAQSDRFAEAEETAREALSIAGDADPALRARILTALGTALVWAGRPADAVAPLEEAVAAGAAARGSDADEETAQLEAEARFALGGALRSLQRYDEALDQLGAARTLHEELVDDRGVAQVLGVTGTVLMETGATAPAEDVYRQALETTRSIGLRHDEGVTQVNLANLLYVTGRVGEAIARYGEAIAVFAEIGNRRGVATTRNNLATVRHTVLGDDALAQRDAEEALAFFREVGDRRFEALAHETLGRVAMRAGRREVARQHLLMALDGAGVGDDAWTAVQTHRALAELELAAADPAAASTHLTTALDLAEAHGQTDAIAGLDALRGLVALAEGDANRAVELTGSAVAGLRPGVDRPELIHLWHHDALEAAGRRQDARAAIERAKARLDELLAGLSHDDREMALRRVPEHRRLVEAWEASQPQEVVATFADAAAPSGRPLHRDELVEVRLTVEAPEDDDTSGAIERRRRQLLRIVTQSARQGAAPTVQDLADVLSVSVATVRRDLKALRDAGHVVDTRGSRAG